MTNTSNAHLPTIVYVEDNAGDALLLEEALRERGHRTQLLVIDHGDKALRYFKVKESANDLPPPHCILLDAHLPVVTGTSLFRFLRATRAYDDTPIYFFANPAHYQTLMVETTVSRESFITKPDSWDGFGALADLLMRSAVAKQNDAPACATDALPEVHATGGLRAQPAPGTTSGQRPG